MALPNLLPVQLSDGQTFTLPAGFMWFTVQPASGASYTVTNGKGTVSGLLTLPFNSGEAPTGEGWNEHIITASGGDIIIVYVTGN